LAQHDGMVVALLDCPQIKRAGLLGTDQIAQAIDIKRPRPGEVAHGQFHVARTHHVERRVENGAADGHCGLLWRFAAACCTTGAPPHRYSPREFSCILRPTISAAVRALASCPAMASSICARGLRRA